MKATIVFQKNWNAINQKNEDGTNKYRYIINMGSSRSSKTISLIQLHDLYARQNPNKRLTIWRDTKYDCRQTILNDALKLLRLNNMFLVGHTYNKTEGKFTYDNFSSIEFLGTDDEEKVHGLTQDCTWLNEPYSISVETFNQLDQRTSDFVFIDYNPKKGHWVEDIAKDERALIIHSTFKDNPFCPVESRNKILSYQPIELCEVVEKNLISIEEARKYDFETNKLKFSENQLKELARCITNENKNSASKFNWQVYGLGLKSEKPNRIFNWSEIPLHEYEAIQKKTYYGCDWGAVDPWAVIEAKYYDGTLYVHEKNYDSENVWRDKISLNERNEIEKQGEEGIVTWLFNQMKIPKNRPIICDNNRPIKISMLRRKGWDYAKPVGNKSKIIDRIDTMNNLKIVYTSTSKNIAYEQENYSRKVDRYGVIMEEAEDKDNHTIDAIAYIVMYLIAEGVIKVF